MRYIFSTVEGRREVREALAAFLDWVHTHVGRRS